MNRSFNPKALDIFLDGVVDSMPGQPSCATPCCEDLGMEWVKIGLRPGDLVLLCLPNGKELLHQFFGILMAKGVPALVAPMTPVSRLRELSKSFGARAIAGFRLPVDGLEVLSIERIGPLQIALLLPPVQQPAALEGEVVMLTSGTSGFASGCVFDFETLLLNAEKHADSIGQRTEDTVLVNLPLYFSYALVAQALASLVRGSRLIISGPPFSVQLYRRTLENFGVTVSSTTPFLIKSVLRSESDFLRKPRVVTVGGDALEPDMVARLLDRRHGGETYLTYGLTQAGPRVSTLAAHAEPASRYGSVGVPLKGTSVYLRPAPDESDLTQLFVCSETVMKRPIGRQEGRPDHALVAPQTIATGDAFEMDSAGYLFFKGRFTDYINRKGEKINLATVRRLASQLPNVVRANTLKIRNENGAEDFDLDLTFNASAEVPLDPNEILRGLLRRNEMPRKVRIGLADEVSALGYK